MVCNHTGNHYITLQQHIHAPVNMVKTWDFVVINIDS